MFSDESFNLECLFRILHALNPILFTGRTKHIYLLIQHQYQRDWGYQRGLSLSQQITPQKLDLVSGDHVKLCLLAHPRVIYWLVVKVLLQKRIIGLSSKSARLLESPTLWHFCATPATVLQNTLYISKSMSKDLSSIKPSPSSNTSDIYTKGLNSPD